MKKDIIDNVKEQFITSVKVNLAELKEKMSSDILSLELSVLYNNRIYNEEASIVQDIFSKLAEDIDELLSHHTEDCMEVIESLLNSIDLKDKVEKITQN